MYNETLISFEMYLFYNLLDEYFIISATSLALAIAALRRVRRQRRVPALRREDLRGLQGLLQEEHQEANRLVLTWMPPNPPSSPVLRVPVPGQQGLPRGQKS